MAHLKRGDIASYRSFKDSRQYSCLVLSTESMGQKGAHSGADAWVLARVHFMSNVPPELVKMQSPDGSTLIILEQLTKIS